MTSATIRREDLYRIVIEAVADGLAIVQKAVSEARFISRYFKFPAVGAFQQSALPHFFTSYEPNKDPLEYQSLFAYKGPLRDENQHQVDCDELRSWRAFKDFAESDSALKKALGLADGYVAPSNDPSPQTKDWHERYYTYGSLANFVDRYIHIAGTTVFDEELFRPIYLEWETALLSPTLWFDIWVPIICVRFDADAMVLDGSSSIQRMSNELQLARNAAYDSTRYSLATHDTVIGAATHALVLRNWRIENHNREGLTMFASFSSALSLIENFFAALRVVTDAETGYSQVVVRPHGWGHGWKAFLPHIYVAATRAYPEHLEDFGWLRPPPVADANTVNEISGVFTALNDLKNNSLAIAVKRLNAAQLRKEKSDSILDVTIALEALLGDESKSEMTHKLAMRMAALSKIEPLTNIAPPGVFKLVKQVYKYRSSIVHGSTKKEEKERVLAMPGGKDVPLVEAGLQLLRHAMWTLTKHPEFLKPEQLDSYLLSTNKV